jgi:deoxyribose-phosphate aldolase
MTAPNSAGPANPSQSSTHSPSTDRQNVASTIDHTLLKSDAGEAEHDQLFQEAKAHQFASVCIRATWIPRAREALRGTGVKVITVVGFPTGLEPTLIKIHETRKALHLGADEVDMVIHVDSLKAKDYGAVLEDIKAVVRAARSLPVKVILETGALTRDEKIAGAVLSVAAGASYVKTSTGFGPGGATVDDVQLLRQIVGHRVGVKASGGIRSREDAVKMLDAGANRLGTSAGVTICKGETPPQVRAGESPGY